MSGWCGWPILKILNIVLLLNFIFVSENDITVVAVAGGLEERSKAGLEEGLLVSAIAVILAHRIIAAIAVIIVISSITTLCTKLT